MPKQKPSILLAYLSQEDGSYSLRGKPEYKLCRRPQLGFQYLSAILEPAGYEVEIHDQSFSYYTFEDFLAHIKAGDYFFVGFYAADATLVKTCQYIKDIKRECDVNVVVGGPGTLHPSPYLEAGADILCIGEGEITVLEICEYLKGERSKDEMRGVCWMEEGRVVRTAHQEFIKDLDTLPFPDRSKIDIRGYYDYYIYNMRVPYVTMMASRGCAYQCSFCTSHDVWRRKVRQRSPENVVAEIDHLVREYGVKYIAFQDDIFAPNMKWLRTFTTLLKSRNHDLKWMCILHPMSLRKDREELLDMLKGAGCDCISMGLQTADPAILEGIRRRSAETGSAHDLIQKAKKRGFLTSMGCIFGLPGDTTESVQKTVDYIMDCKPHHAEFYTLTVIRGSQIDKDFGTNPVCELGEEQLRSLTASASRKFYTHPKTLWRNLSYVLRKRPSWLLVAIPFLPNLIRVTGIIGQNNFTRPGDYVIPQIKSASS